MWKEDIQISRPFVFMEPQISSSRDLVSLKTFNAYILVFNTVQEWKKWLEAIFHHFNWNPKAKFIAAFEEDVNMTEVFEIAWKYNMINFNLHFDNEIYTYFPYNWTNCILNFKPVVLHSCHEEIKDIFPNKIPKSLNGCPIKLLGNIIPPYVTNLSANRNDPNKAGIETTLVHVMSKKLNFAENYITNRFKIWGNRLPNGSYTDMFNTIIDKSAELMFGMAGIGIENVELVTMKMHLHEELLWWVPAASQEPVWKNVVKIYKPFMWILIVLIIIINSFVWWIISQVHHKYSTSNRDKFNFISSILIICCSFLQWTVIQPTSAPLKLHFIFWVASSLILTTAYQSQLTSTLTKPRYENQISSVKDLLASKLKFGFYQPVSPFYSNPNNTIERYILNNYIACPLTEECLNRTAFKRDFAVVKNRRQSYFLIKKYYSNPDGSSMLFGFGYGMKVRMGIIVQRGYPLLPLFNPLIQRLTENGLINNWDQDFTHVRKIHTKPMRIPLTVINLQYALILLFAGFCFSILVFICEIFWGQVKKVSV